jgi:hypothetical protein
VLSAAKERSLLAALALRPGTVVSSDELVDAVWGEQPPGDSAQAGGGVPEPSAEVDDFLHDVEAQAGHRRTEERELSALKPQHRLPVARPSRPTDQSGLDSHA